MGARSLENNKISLKLSLPISIILLISSIMVSFQLFPFNNTSLSYIGAIKYIFEYFAYGKTSFDAEYHLGTVFFFAAIFLIAPLILSQFKINFKKIIKSFSIFFVLVNIGIFVITMINAQVWYESDQMQIGLWLNKNDPKISRVMFDKDYIGKATKTEQDEFLGQGYTIAGFWMNDEIKFDDLSSMENYDFIISKKELDKKKLTKKGEWSLYSV